MGFKISGTEVINDSSGLVGISNITVSAPVASGTHRVGFVPPPPPPPPPPGTYGTLDGYVIAGNPPVATQDIQKFSFASDATITDVGDANRAIYWAGYSSSDTHAYQSHGSNRQSPPVIPGNTYRTDVKRFSFATNAAEAYIPDMGGYGTSSPVGHSSTEKGYASGGRAPFGPPLDTKRRFIYPFASASSSRLTNKLTEETFSITGCASSTDGYIYQTTGPTGVVTGNIQKFPFASDEDVCSNVGTLTSGARSGSGQNSSTHGYSTGGDYPSPINTIEKFPFASESTISDVGDLITPKAFDTGLSSTVSGYTAGGGPSALNTVEKFPFASDTNASDVGDLAVATLNAQGGHN